MDWEARCSVGFHVVNGFRFKAGDQMDMRLGYRTLGTLNERGDNAVLLLHGTVGSSLQYLQRAWADALFGSGAPLDADRYFIVLPDAIGHGLSSKPSNDLNVQFPRYGYGDIVTAQHAVVSEKLNLAHLRLVMGCSMGGMQTWLWGTRHPDMMDALMPIASLPERITGRNLLWRRLLLQIARLDAPGERNNPPNGLGLAWGLFQMMGASPARLAEGLTSSDVADAYIQSVSKEALRRENLPDVIAEFEASWDFDASRELDRIKAPLLALNFSDDDINPVALKSLERAVSKVSNGELVHFSAGEKSLGHQTLAAPGLWKDHVLQILKRSERSHRH